VVDVCAGHLGHEGDAPDGSAGDRGIDRAAMLIRVPGRVAMKVRILVWTVSENIFIVAVQGNASGHEV
jgi:hypothetical protein